MPVQDGDPLAACADPCPARASLLGINRAACCPQRQAAPARPLDPRRPPGLHPGPFALHTHAPSERHLRLTNPSYTAPAPAPAVVLPGRRRTSQARAAPTHPNLPWSSPKTVPTTHSNTSHPEQISIKPPHTLPLADIPSRPSGPCPVQWARTLKKAPSLHTTHTLPGPLASSMSDGLSAATAS